MSCDREPGHKGDHRGYLESVDEPVFWSNLPPPFHPCALCGGPMSVSMELGLFPEGTAGWLPDRWWARTRAHCRPCRYTEARSWAHGRPGGMLGKADPYQELEDIYGALVELWQGLDELKPSDVKRKQKGGPRGE